MASPPSSSLDQDNTTTHNSMYLPSEGTCKFGAACICFPQRLTSTPRFWEPPYTRTNETITPSSHTSVIPEATHIPVPATPLPFSEQKELQGLTFATTPSPQQKLVEDRSVAKAQLAKARQATKIVLLDGHDAVFATAKDLADAVEFTKIMETRAALRSMRGQRGGTKEEKVERKNADRSRRLAEWRRKKVIVGRVLKRQGRERWWEDVDAELHGWEDRVVWAMNGEPGAGFGVLPKRVTKFQKNREKRLEKMENRKRQDEKIILKEEHPEDTPMEDIPQVETMIIS